VVRRSDSAPSQSRDRGRVCPRSTNASQSVISLAGRTQTSQMRGAPVVAVISPWHQGVPMLNLSHVSCHAITPAVSVTAFSGGDPIDDIDIQIPMHPRREPGIASATHTDCLSTQGLFHDSSLIKDPSCDSGRAAGLTGKFLEHHRLWNQSHRPCCS
jgi:hypothetical protein